MTSLYTPTASSTLTTLAVGDFHIIRYHKASDCGTYPAHTVRVAVIPANGKGYTSFFATAKTSADAAKLFDELVNLHCALKVANESAAIAREGLPAIHQNVTRR